MRPAYQQYGEAQTDLVRRIKNISDELVLLARLISHGEAFEPDQSQPLEDYIASISNQIGALAEMIKAAETGLESEHSDITDRVAQFSAESLQVMEQLKNLRSLPSLSHEKEQLNAAIDNFDEFAENLSQDPSRPDILRALETTQALQANINAQIEAVRENPLVNIAECWFEGAVAVNDLNGPRLKGPSHSL